MRRLLLALALALPLFGQAGARVTVPAICENDSCGTINSLDIDAPSDDSRTFYDGCNWCSCSEYSCDCTAMACLQPEPEQERVIYEKAPELQAPEAPRHRGILRKFLRWLW